MTSGSWASSARAAIDPFTLTGPLTIGATSRPVVVELGRPAASEGGYSRVELALYNGWNLDRGPDSPRRYSRFAQSAADASVRS
ncbi:MAG: hypothetical protein ABJE66_01145 [Deltaproteobacteria bacterium]